MAAGPGRWVLKDEDVENSPHFTFPICYGVAELIVGELEEQRIKVELKLRWGALDILKWNTDEFIHSVSLSQMTIEYEDTEQQTLKIFNKEKPYFVPIRLYFENNPFFETCATWKIDLVKSSKWKITDFYEVVKHIATGGNGRVSEVTKQQKSGVISKGQHVAMKRIERKKPEESQFKSYLNELEIWQDLRHRNLLRVEDILVDEEYAYLISELLDSTVEKLSNNRTIKRDPERKNIAQKNIVTQILYGIQWMHDEDLLHRDIKLSNVLCEKLDGVENEYKVKICDFGYAVKCSNQCVERTIRGTKGYRSPEIFSRHTYSRKSDVWAIGVILYAITVKKRPFKCGSKEERKHILDDLPDEQLNNYFSDEMKDVIKAMLRKDPDERPNIEDLLEMDWF